MVKALLPGQEQGVLWALTAPLSAAGADKKAEAGAGAATEFQFVSICMSTLLSLMEEAGRSCLRDSEGVREAGNCHLSHVACLLWGKDVVGWRPVTGLGAS